MGPGTLENVTGFGRGGDAVDVWGTIRAGPGRGSSFYVAAVPGLLFAFCFYINMTQLTTCGGASEANTKWIVTFLSYCGGGLVCAVTYFWHNVRVWHAFNRLSEDSCPEFRSFTLRWRLEVRYAFVARPFPSGLWEAPTGQA